MADISEEYVEVEKNLGSPELKSRLTKGEGKSRTRIAEVRAVCTVALYQCSPGEPTAALWHERDGEATKKRPCPECELISALGTDKPIEVTGVAFDGPPGEARSGRRAGSKGWVASHIGCAISERR